MTIKDMNAKRFTRSKFFLYGFLAGVICLAVFSACLFHQAQEQEESEPQPEPEPVVVNEVYVRECLMPAAELTSAKYVFSGIMDYDNKKIPVINKSRFSMFYTATVRIGIPDLSQAIVEVDDDTITVILPASTITEVTIHPESLRFFDEKSSLMSNHKRDEVKAALVAVQDDARKADMTECLDVADDNVEEIVRDFLEKSGVLDERKLVIQHMPRRSSTAESAHIDSGTY